jgi:MoxR-like ATPase
MPKLKATALKNAAHSSVASRNARNRDHTDTQTSGVHEIATLNGEKLIVTDQDVIFDAAKTLLCTRSLGNVMFLGEAGTGKTRRAESLTLSDNYPVFLADTALSGITVHIKMIEVDMISTNASAELLYDSTLEDGNFARQAAVVADFIQQHGTTDRREFDKKQLSNQKTLETGKGDYFLYLLLVDDFDRTYTELQNAFMRLIHGVRHTFQRLKTPPVFLRLQCIATSNSGLGTPSGKYCAAAGRIDQAVGNRFTVYNLPEPDFEYILNRCFPSVPDFCKLVARLVSHVKAKQRDGELEKLGEVSLRQLFPLIEHKLRWGLSNEEAAARLFLALPPDGDERTQANLIMSQYFGSIRISQTLF